MICTILKALTVAQKYTGIWQLRFRGGGYLHYCTLWQRYPMFSLLQRIKHLYIKAFSGLPRKVWLLALVLLVNRSGAMVVTFLSVYLIKEQGYAPIKGGYVMAAFGAGGVLGNYFGGLLNDRYGSWHIQLYSMIGAGILNIMLGYATEFWALCALAFCISLVADAFRPANRAAIAIYAPKAVLTQAYGLQRMAVNLGFSIGPALGGYLIYAFGYKLMFWGDGLTFLLAAGVFYLALPADETARPLVARVKKNKLEEETLDGQILAPASAAKTTPAHHQRWLLAFVVANTAIMICFFQLFANFPVHLSEFDIDERAIGWLFTISGVVIVALEMPLIYIAERRYKPIPVMLVGAALIAGSFLLLPASLEIGYVAVLGMVIILTIGEIFYMPFTNTYVSTYAPLARRGEYLGLLSASYSAAFVLCPLITFYIAEYYGYTEATIACVGIAAIGWLILTRINAVRERSTNATPSEHPLPSSV
ncbi:MAG: putative MFS family arabinose efflux permease [Neolewinella sp.]